MRDPLNIVHVEYTPENGFEIVNMEDIPEFAIEDYDLLIIDNLYTENYLEGIKNKKESVFKYLNMEFSDNIMEKIMDKYSLVPSNHIVDLLYEAIIYENSKGE